MLHTNVYKNDYVPVFVLYCLAPNTNANNTRLPQKAIGAKTNIQIGVKTETTTKR